jgi:chorismate dehydratase
MNEIKKAAGLTSRPDAMTTSTLRFAYTPYANQLPLSYFIPEVAGHARLVAAEYPSAVPAQIESGAADAALLPVAELARRPNLVMIGGLGVCACRQVRSVLLKCRVPLPQVRTVATDPASLTSNALVQVLFRNHWKQAVRFVVPEARVGQPGPQTRENAFGSPMPSAGIEDRRGRRSPMSDATVMIGDRALCAPPAPAGDIDLAGAWYEMTALPFVFAVWVHRREHAHATALAQIAHAAKRKGVAELPMLADLVAQRLGLGVDDCLDYLTNCIYFDMGDPEREAIHLFWQMAGEGQVA